MFTIPKYKDRISLIPCGCPQFLDFAANLDALPRVYRSFEELEVQGDGPRRVQLRPLVQKDLESDELVGAVDGEPARSNDPYMLDGKRVLQAWLGHWFPVPFFRERDQIWEEGGESRLEFGPSNWARAYLSINEDQPDILRIVLIFDMQLEEDTEGNYCALAPKDVAANAQFRLAWHPRDNDWFLNMSWVNEWLAEIWGIWRDKPRSRYQEEAEMEHLASYLTMLELLHHAIGRRKVYVIDPKHHAPIDVDLVLDIGNSRSTGILVETQAQRATDLNDSYLLQLRNLSQPENVYTEPFETRVEFSETTFGNDAYSKRSGRESTAFTWPSPVRTGPEAAHLATLSRCVEGATGMSSPKRYLWDERDWQQSWRYNTRGRGEPYVTSGGLAAQLNQSGTPLCCMDDPLFTKNKILRKQDDSTAFESRFTRSSLMMFLLVEIFQQALLTINSPGQRDRRSMTDVPRRLRQVIFTVPDGMPLAEQRIYRRWAKWAVRALWETLGWKAFYEEKVGPRNLQQDGPASDYRSNPQVRCNWDEATCTQLVYIYNELTRNYQGDAKLFCRLAGRPRPIEQQKRPGETKPRVVERPTVRLATIDVGGGTTDLSITTYELQDDVSVPPRIAPHPEFHDGFNLAGDDVLFEVIRKHVLTALGEAMQAAGVPNVDKALADLFGRNTMNLTQEMRNRRQQFIRQVAIPVALCVLSVYEQADLTSGSNSLVCRFRDCFRAPELDDEEDENQDQEATVLPCELHPMPTDTVLGYVEQHVQSFLDPDTRFSVLDVSLRIDARRVDETVRSVLKDALANLCEIIHLYNCDTVLLAGRPSRWQGIVESVFANLPVAPDRIIAMGDYPVGNWYPFADSLGNMTDPKTTVVVGAILCALAEGQLAGLSFDTTLLPLASTARFIGAMRQNGQIERDKVWFEIVNTKKTLAPEQRNKPGVPTPVSKGGCEMRTIEFGGPIPVGFRQLDVERWTTTRFYLLDWAEGVRSEHFSQKLPFTVDLSFEVKDDDQVRDEGEFAIDRITDRDDMPVATSTLVLRLQTLPREEGAWLDTGIMYD